LGATAHASGLHPPPLAPPDLSFFANSRAASGFRRSLAEAFARGTGGFAQDMIIEGRAWAFDASKIDVPVRVIHGDADTLAPLAHAHHTAELIPRATMDVIPGQGHLSIIDFLPDIVTDLAAELR
jgi:pimeloyl-ACP methyl ester carboxylesterase